MERNVRKKRGVITIALGHAAYRRQALALRRSICLHNRDLPIGVLTDRDEPDLLEFDHVILANPDKGGALRQKLCLDEYTPFDQTLFIDSDCLVTRSLDAVFAVLGAEPFGITADPIHEGIWYRNVPGWLAQLGAESIPMCSSGVFAFRSDQLASAFFRSAREFYDRYDEYDIPKTHHHPSDEPAISMAMIRHGLPGVKKDFTIQATTVTPGFRGVKINVLRGESCFDLTTLKAHPAVSHFVGSGRCSPSYRREVARLASLFGKQTGSIFRKESLWLLEIAFVCERFANAAYRIVRVSRRMVKAFAK